MPRMDNYFWVDDNHRILLPDELKDYHLSGNCYGRIGFSDGDAVVSSRVKSVVGPVVLTISGSSYLLGNMHPDYDDLLGAVQTGIPVIDSWSLSGSTREGYCLSGLVGRERISGKVEGQHGNYVTIDGVDFYVIWRNVRKNEYEQNLVGLTGKYCDMYLKENFKEYMNNPHAKPILFE